MPAFHSTFAFCIRHALDRSLCACGSYRHGGAALGHATPARANEFAHAARLHWRASRQWHPSLGTPEHPILVFSHPGCNLMLRPAVGPRFVRWHLWLGFVSLGRFLKMGAEGPGHSGTKRWVEV